MRLNSDGTLDRSLGDEGALVLDGRPHRPEVGPVLGVHDGFVVPFALRSLFGETSVSARGAQPIQASAVPNPGSDAALGLLRQWDDGRPGRDPAPRPQPPSTTPAPAPTATTTTTPVEAKAESRSPRIERICLSRRRFTIRLRPKRRIVSARVTVAGKRVAVRRRNGRLTAVVDLRRLRQATFTVRVVGKDRRGRTIRETRRYRTCRVGTSGRKVIGGSTIVLVAS